MTVVARDALSYERLTQLGVNKRWMPPLAVLIAVLGTLLIFCVTLSVATVIGHLQGVPGNKPTNPETILTPYADTIILLATTGLIIPVMLLIVRLVQRRPAGTLHSVEGRIRWRWLAVCTVLSIFTTGLLFYVMTLVYDDLSFRLRIDWSDFAVIAVVLIVLVPLQAAGEEYLTRGFLLQTLGLYGRWIGVVGSSAVFAALHGWGTGWGFTALFAGACMWAMLVIRTGGLEVSIAAHATTNLIVFLLLAADGGLNVVDNTTAADADQSTFLLLLGADIFYSVAVLTVMHMLTRHRPSLLPRNRMDRGPALYEEWRN